uniref:Uncharacterized protein n=1 Tax=Anguilla anguilla TaxID=7936 RepID=A0A0E9TI30_ANGAN
MWLRANGLNQPVTEYCMVLGRGRLPHSSPI